MNLNFQNNNSPTFELVLMQRDSLGNITNKTKSFKTYEPVSLERVYIRNSGKPKKKKRRRVDAAKKEDVKKILQEVNKYTEKKDNEQIEK